MHDFIDLERCVWDADYRRAVKGILNVPALDVRGAANQNAPAARPGKVPRPH
jgi:hypothetical protein